MANKFVVKTTEEYTYDKEGRVTKKITTEESYEIENENVSLGDFVKKAVGVPNTGTVTTKAPYTTTVSYDSVNPLTHTIGNSGHIKVD